MSKFKKHFQTMIEENADLFNEFKSLDTTAESFNVTGNKILRVIRRYEDELCSRSEGGRYGKFSENLSEKFWEEVRGYIPTVDAVRLD